MTKREREWERERERERMREWEREIYKGKDTVREINKERKRD